MGTAKVRPDSFTPRRLASVIRRMSRRQIGTVLDRSSGKADVMAATPADTDTATVRM